jgi:hypothetical protein
MRLSCPYCGTGSFVPDPAAQGAPRELRCQQCRTEIALPQQAVENAPTRAELFDGRYEKLAPPSASDQGVVFPAYDRTLRTFVAVKELASATERPRFERELALAKVLTHENIIAIYDHGQSRDLRYLTMEYLEGASLHRLLQAGDLAYERALDLMIMACQGLEYVHVRGVVHRALEPGKLFVTSDGVLKLMEFGSAGSESDDPASLAARARATPGYTAPELAATPASVSPRADVWSLGAVAYRLFTGVLPYPELGEREAAGEHRPPAPPSTLNARVPAELDAVILRALAIRAEDRPADASELCEQLMAQRRKHSPQPVAAAPITSVRPGPTARGERSPRALVMAGVAVAALLGGGALLMRGREAGHTPDAVSSVPSDAIASHAGAAPAASTARSREQPAASTPAPAAGASAPRVEAQQPRQAEPVAPPQGTSASAAGQSGPRALLGAPRCPAGAEAVPARALQLAQPRPRAWGFAERTLPTLPLEGFCMDARSVSVAAYAKCVEEGRCSPHEAACTPSSDPSAAMKCVSWAAAQQYCAARGATLPSVAQWEAYALAPNARTSTSEWALDAFPPAVFAARCNEDNPARCDGHLWRKAGRLPTVGPDGRGQLAFSWNRGAATSVSGYDYVSFRCVAPTSAR